jgi:hypothetical protein
MNPERGGEIGARLQPGGEVRDQAIEAHLPPRGMIFKCPPKGRLQAQRIAFALDLENALLAGRRPRLRAPKPACGLRATFTDKPGHDLPP